MLVNLHISNYALIEQLTVEFSHGLNIITGETGAGKSIILGALDLLRGRRADTSALRDQSRKAISEAMFDISRRDRVSEWLKKNEWDIQSDGMLALRREILPSGRSRAFINDTPATLQDMQSITSLLLDIHSQHHTRKLSDPSARLEIIDSLSTDKTSYIEFCNAYNKARTSRNHVKKLQQQLLQMQQRRQHLSEQLDALRKLAPKKGELKELEEIFDIQSRASELKESMGTVRVSLDNYNNSARQLIEDAIRNLKQMHLPELEREPREGEPSLIKRLETLLIDLKEINFELEHLDARLDDDPKLRDRTERRLDLYYQTQMDFKVDDAEIFPQMMSDIAEELNEINDPAEELKEAEKVLEQNIAILRERAAELSITRTKEAKAFSNNLTDRARQLGLPNLIFNANVIQLEKVYPDGNNKVDFMCSFNKNQALMPVEDTASGGEASRLMLAMKAIIAGKMELPTIIFDEIDTGISGEIAALAGRMMRDIAKNLQVIAITHLPQVAACGDTHFKVSKHDDEISTLTRIDRLDEENRRIEIAKMLSGTTLDEAALRNADSLLSSSHH